MVCKWGDQRLLSQTIVGLSEIFTWGALDAMPGAQHSNVSCCFLYLSSMCQYIDIHIDVDIETDIKNNMSVCIFKILIITKEVYL